MRDLRAEELIRAEFCAQPLRCGNPKRGEILDEVERLRKCVGAFGRLCHDQDVRMYLDWTIQSLADFGSDPRRGHLQRAGHWLGEVYRDPAARESGLDACVKQIQIDVRRLAQSEHAFNAFLVQ